MKALSDSLKDLENHKRQLEEKLDNLNEECAKLKAKGLVKRKFDRFERFEDKIFVF